MSVENFRRRTSRRWQVRLVVGGYISLRFHVGFAAGFYYNFSGMVADSPGYRPRRVHQTHDKPRARLVLSYGLSATQVWVR